MVIQLADIRDSGPVLLHLAGVSENEWPRQPIACPCEGTIANCVLCKENADYSSFVSAHTGHVVGYNLPKWKRDKDADPYRRRALWTIICKGMSWIDNSPMLKRVVGDDPTLTKRVYMAYNFDSDEEAIVAMFILSQGRVVRTVTHAMARVIKHYVCDVVLRHISHTEIFDAIDGMSFADWRIFRRSLSPEMIDPLFRRTFSAKALCDAIIEHTMTAKECRTMKHVLDKTCIERAQNVKFANSEHGFKVRNALNRPKRNRVVLNQKIETVEDCIRVLDACVGKRPSTMLRLALTITPGTLPMYLFKNFPWQSQRRLVARVAQMHPTIVDVLCPEFAHRTKAWKEYEDAHEPNPDNTVVALCNNLLDFVWAPRYIIRAIATEWLRKNMFYEDALDFVQEIEQSPLLCDLPWIVRNERGLFSTTTSPCPEFIAKILSDPTMPVSHSQVFFMFMMV